MAGTTGCMQSVKPPVAAATDNVSTGVAPLTVQLDASGSSDPQNRGLTYSWSFSDGTSSVSGATVSHTFQNHGSYTATVNVSNGKRSDSKTLTILVTPAPPTVQATNVQVNVLGIAPTTITAQVVASDRESLPLTYSIASPPSIGTATIDPSSGALSYTVDGLIDAGSTAFSVAVANSGASASGTVTLLFSTDPLLGNQWHIQNTGQDAFSTTRPVAGNDMDVAGAWGAGYSGKAIKVGVVDSGLEAAHEDLAANVDLTHSHNFVNGSSDPSPDPTVAGFDHGTAVSGIIAAVAFNDKGGRGVAYNASLRGYNILADGGFSLANMSDAFGGQTYSADNDLFNASFEAVSNGLPSYSGAYQAITQTTLGLRGGLGAAIVNAAGNDFESFEGQGAVVNALCQVSQQYHVSCGDTATDERRGGYAPIIVAALAADGTHATYSSTGTSIWIAAPGGEYGINQSVYGDLSALTDAADLIKPAIITTNRTGCANAPYPAPVNGLDLLGGNPLAPACQYTAVMNGTSSATPNVAGVVALMLEANPNLSVRDIKYLLATTAHRVDPGFAGVSATGLAPGAAVTLEQGWVTNAAGFTFSNRYGFGGVDAAAAVSAARSYSSYLPALATSASYNITSPAPGTVPAASATGSTLTFAVNETFKSIEFAEVFLNIDSTPGLSCNQIELTSPSGTKSILVHAANGFSNVAVVNSRIESNAFYGEAPNGTWSLRFMDLCTAGATATTLSTTQPQTLILLGH